MATLWTTNGTLGTPFLACVKKEIPNPYFWEKWLPIIVWLGWAGGEEMEILQPLDNSGDCQLGDRQD